MQGGFLVANTLKCRSVAMKLTKFPPFLCLFLIKLVTRAILNHTCLKVFQYIRLYNAGLQKSHLVIHNIF